MSRATREVAYGRRMRKARHFAKSARQRRVDWILRKVLG